MTWRNRPITHLPRVEPVTRPRHYGGFLLAGLAALATDAALLTLLTDVAGVSPYLARLASIMIAMVVSWQLNRRITFAVRAPSTLHEFARFAAVSWGAQFINYGTFAALITWLPTLWPVWALIAGSALAMFASYAGYRFGVFPKP
jgi:putative flippase GtrA